MEKQELVVQRRWKAGKAASGRLRARGFIPAVCYRKGVAPISLSMERHKLQKLLSRAAGQSVLIQLNIQDDQGGEEQETVILKEIQRNPFAAITHVDFLMVKMDEMIAIEVPLRFVGEPTEALRTGGLVNQLRRFVEVECLPGDIPEHIDVDISGLRIGDPLHVEQIQAGEGIRILTDKKEPIVVVSMPAVEVEEKKAAEGEEAVEETAEKPEEETK